MANMNFGVNILPKTNNTYTLGNSDYKWQIYASSINGSAPVTASSIADKADKEDTVLDTTLSRGRTTGSTVGTGSFAFGDSVTASGNYSHAEGESCTASGAASHAEGTTSYATGSYAHAEGRQTSSSGVGAHSEGKNTNASGNYSHAEGEQTTAYAQSSHVVGRYNYADTYLNWPTWTASTSYEVGDKVQHVENGTRRGYICKTANSDAEFDSSNWNADVLMNFVEIVGNGTNTNSKCNARAVDWNGNEYLYGDLYVDCDSDSTGGTSVISFAPQVGEIRIWAGDTAPDKWMICNGSVISRETYMDLFTEIGTTYGGGDGSTTFAIPNFKGRMPCGAGESTANGHVMHTLGISDGEEKHVLTSGELAAHAHTFSKATATTSGKYKKNAQSGSNTNRVDADGTSSTTGPYTTTLSLTLNNTGSNTAHNNMPPYTNVNFIIYVGVSAA